MSTLASNNLRNPRDDGVKASAFDPKPPRPESPPTVYARICPSPLILLSKEILIRKLLSSFIYDVGASGV